MNTIRLCSSCAKPLPPDAPAGLCPVCLLKTDFGAEPVAENTPPSPAEIAGHFPHLEILELIGRGGMGIVYKARQPKLDRLVALKILPIASMPDASFGERFEREAKALARLNHSGIVNVYDFGQTKDFYYFVMEFVDGMNLRQLIRAKTLEPRQALELVTLICTALQFAHDEKIVHRDIKPENILITKKGQVKIADFGLAKLLGSQPDTALTASQMVMGTLNYMAPEQRENTKDVDHRADIYSLGVVFYEMLTGEVPMGRFDAPSKKVQIDVRLDEVVLRALEREPSRRYQHVSEVKTNVETITSTMPPVSPVPPAVPVPAGMTPKRFHFLIKFLVALLIAAGVVCFLSAKDLTNSDRLVLLLSVGIFSGSILFLYQRQQIERARKKGLWPPWGELPTLEHVKALMQAGETILAIKLYRQIHPVSLLDAKIAVEKLVPSVPLSTTPSPAASTPRKMAVFWLCAYGLFCLGWLVTKMLWNFRSPGCWLACFGMAALVMCVSGITVKRMRLFPAEFSLKKAMLKSKYLWALVPIFLALTLGFVFLIGGFFNLWEQGPLHGNFSAKSPEQFEAANKGTEYKLIRNLEAFSNDIPNVELGVYQTIGHQVGVTDVWFPFPPWIWSGPPGKDHFLTNDLLVVGCFLLVWGLFCLICGWRGPGTKPFRAPWRNVLASLAVSACVLGSVFPIYVVCHLCEGYSHQSGQFFSKTKKATVADNIQKWAIQNRYAMGDEVEWDIDTVPKGKRVAKVSIREAWKPSPFDRWQSTWTSFRRVSPYLAFELVSSENPDQTIVYVSSSMIGTIPEDLFPFLTRCDQTNPSGK